MIFFNPRPEPENKSKINETHDDGFIDNKYTSLEGTQTGDLKTYQSTPVKKSTMEEMKKHHTRIIHETHEENYDLDTVQNLLQNPGSISNAILFHITYGHISITRTTTIAKQFSSVKLTITKDDAYGSKHCSIFCEAKHI